MQRPDPPGEPTLRRTMAQLCHRLHAAGLLVALDGNLSARLPDGSILCTRAGCHKGFVTEDDLVVTDPSGHWLRGLGRPTSELKLHLACYDARPDIHAIVHAHPPHAIACTVAGVDLDRPLLPEVVLTLGTIPTVPYATTGSQTLAQAVGRAAQLRDALLLDRHGAVSLGRDLHEAFGRMETVEQVARIALLARSAGRLDELPRDEAVRLRRAGLQRYGGPPAAVARAQDPDADLKLSRVVVKPFDLAYHYASAHGILASVHLPDSPDPVPPDVLDRLHPGEVSHASTLRGFRQVSFVGGRLAVRLAAQQLGLQPPAVLPDDRGCPVLPPELLASVSHKRTLAVAMVARNHGWSLGIDLEDYGPPRPGIASRVLTPRERAIIESLPSDRQWPALLLRFSVKEAIYKALDPWVRRYVGFQEAEVDPDTDGGVEVTLNLEQGEGPFQIDAHYRWLHGRLLSSVQVRPLSTASAAASGPPPTDAGPSDG